MAERSPFFEDHSDMWNSPVVPSTAVRVRDLVRLREVAENTGLHESIVEAILRGDFAPERDPYYLGLVEIRQNLRLLARTRALSSVVENLDVNGGPTTFSPEDRLEAARELVVLSALHAGNDHAKPS
jgi:hypothetical protein